MSSFRTELNAQSHRLKTINLRTEKSFFVGKRVANKMNCPSFPFLKGSLSFVFFLIVTIKGPF